MLGQMNRKMSLNARLLLVAGCFTAPIALLLTLFTQAQLAQIDFSDKELDGANYIEAVQRALLDEKAGAAALADQRVKFDSQFGVAGLAEAFANASTADARAEAASALIAAVADGSNLTLDPELDTFYLMDAVTIGLPKMKEHLETMVEASRKGDREQMLVLQAQLQEYFERVQTSVSRSIEGNKSGHTRTAMQAKMDALIPAARRLFDAGDAAFAASSIPVLDGAALGKAINEAEAAGADELQYLLQKRVERLQQQLAMGLGAVVIFLIAAIGIMGTFSVGLSGRIRRIVECMDRLQNNDLTAEIPCVEDTNETGKIAQSLVAFRQSLAERAALQAESLVIHEQTAAKLKAMEETHRAASEELQLVVREMKEDLGNLHRGDLTSRVEVYFPENYKTIRMDLNDTSKKLAEMILESNQSAGGMLASAGEISDAANALSQRTEQQAASLEETAAALDEITAAVQSSAKGAAETQEKARTARDETVSSREILQNTIEAMNRIEKSSQQIAQIIGVIDEIAFQTNLLALNAGVEAARAGDAGRGFAVVAQEVRALAQRSAAAAKEIKELISASTSQVGEGVRLVDQTGDALHRIVSRVLEIDTVVAEIAASANEQSSALGEVNAAVNLMDQATQQNAAMVEQSTAATHSLEHETASLVELMKTFELGEVQVTQPARSPSRAAQRPPPPPRQPAQKPVVQGNLAVASQAPAGDDWEEF